MVMNVNVPDNLLRGIRPTFGYYRQPNGWITISPTTRLERIKYIEEGWEHLEKYGAFDMTPYVTNHPLEMLIMFGGTEELLPEQIIQQGLHADPPLIPTCNQHINQFHKGHGSACWVGARKVRFPQLKEMDNLGPFPCNFCNRQLPTVEAREQHQSVAHKEQVGDLRTGRSLGDAIAAAMNAPSQGDEDTKKELEELKRLVAALTAQTESTP